jgi:PEP-CTERM motif
VTGLKKNKETDFMRSIKSVAANILMTVATLGIVATSALAGPITQPVGLVAGDQYRLAFVTSDTRDATSSNIGDYNSFVNTVGLAATGIGGWKAIASTSAIDARDNTATNPFDGSDPNLAIYRLDGLKVADDNFDLWTGSTLPRLDHSLSIDETGVAIPGFANYAWTGTSADGTKYVWPLGHAGINLAGRIESNSNTWIFSDGFDEKTLLHLYAISGVITVPGTGGKIPEPTTLAIFGLGLAGLCLMRRRKPAA